MRPDIKEWEYMYRVVISQLLYDGHQQLALDLASSIGCSANPPAPCDKLFRLISMHKQFDEAEQKENQQKENGFQFDADSAGLALEFDADIMPQSPEPFKSERIFLTPHKASCRSAAFNSDDTRMPVATIGDLPLELVEGIARYLDVKDVAKLMMVNKRLYASYAIDQSIVFGKHVSMVELGHSSEPRNRIEKLNSNIFPWFYFTLHLDSTLHPFVKRIDSCDSLVFREGYPINGMFLNQLKSVHELEFHVDRKEPCLKFLTNFRGLVKKRATLNIRIGSFEQDQEMKEQLGKFIENQLNGCEEITLWYCNFEDCFHFYHEALMKTQIKMIIIPTSRRFFEQILGCIVNQGIPSKNSEAVIRIQTDYDNQEERGVGDFLSQVQGLQRVDDGEDHSALVCRANELLGGYEEDEDKTVCVSAAESTARRVVSTCFAST